MFDGLSVMEIIRMLLPLIILELGLKAYCLVKIGRGEVKSLPAWAWTAIVILISTFGPVAYLLVGRERKY